MLKTPCVVITKSNNLHVDENSIFITSLSSLKFNIIVVISMSKTFISVKYCACTMYTIDVFI